MHGRGLLEFSTELFKREVVLIPGYSRNEGMYRVNHFFLFYMDEAAVTNLPLNNGQTI